MNWLELTLLLSLSGSSLILSMRAITHDTNPFVFMTFVMGLGAIALFAYCLATETPIPFGGQVIKTALFAGFSVALLDLAFIFMFRKGAQVSVAMPIFRVSSIILSALMGLAFFKEHLSPLNMAGIVLACIAVYLLNSNPKKGELL